MRTPATRLPRDFDLGVELHGLRSVVEADPMSCRGSWARLCWPVTPERPDGSFSEVRVDYGCGMGDYTVAAALREPDVLFVGVEREPVCIARAGAKALAAGARNVVFAPLDGSTLDLAFARDEVSVLHINFPTPYARKRDATKRMTHLRQLLCYRRILAPGGLLRLKTDSQPLRDFTLTQLALAGYHVDWSVDDVREALPDDPVTGYERRLVAKGATVYALQATPGPLPTHIEQTAALSLFDYLPEDLESMAYVPLGMERSVENLVHARRKIAANHARVAAARQAGMTHTKRG